MSLYVLVTGPLIAEPQRRTGASGKDFATGTLRVATDDDSILVSVIGFGDAAEMLLAHRHGSTLAVSGRAKLTSWRGKSDDKEHHGLSVVIEHIASASAARRADAERRRERRAA
jgi:single-stranded DNA-binding protein